MEFNEQIKTVITAFSDSITNESLEENQEILIKLKSMYKRNEAMFLDALEIGTHEFDMLLEGVFEIPPQKNQHLIKYIANGLYEHFHQERIRKLEGFACCADKSSYIQTMTLNALKTQQNLSLFADYLNVKEIKKDKEQQAYWSPKSVKDTDEAIQLFWDWYRLKDY